MNMYASQPANQPVWDCRMTSTIFRHFIMYMEYTRSQWDSFFPSFNLSLSHTHTYKATSHPASQCTFSPFSLYFHRYCSIKACWNKRHFEYIKILYVCICATLCVTFAATTTKNIYYMALTLTCKNIEYDSFDGEEKNRNCCVCKCVVCSNEIISGSCKNIHECNFSPLYLLSLRYNKYAYELFGKQIGLYAMYNIEIRSMTDR